MKWKLLLSVAMLVGCARAPLKTPDQAMRPAAGMPADLADDLDLASLAEGLAANVEFLRAQTPEDRAFYFGPRRLTKAEYLRGLEFLLRELRADRSGARFREALRAHFEAFEVYGEKDWGDVLVTSYFEPVIDGARKKVGRFTRPIYGLPPDLVSIDVASFGVVPDGKIEQRSPLNFWRGRMLPPEAPELTPRVVAYPARDEINRDGVKAPVLAWADPIDAFFLEIQGSGVVRLKGGKELRLGYAAQNGRPYVPIGKFLFDVIPREKITMPAIEAHLRALPEEDARRLMEMNPSYVFFRPVPRAGLTYLGTEVVGGRTIATDAALFPKGALAFLEFEKPVFASATSMEPSGWVRASRFVLDQDTGGAIRGPSRVDLFWGRGAESKRSAGAMKQRGRLIYFVPRPELTAGP